MPCTPIVTVRYAGTTAQGATVPGFWLHLPTLYNNPYHSAEQPCLPHNKQQSCGAILWQFARQGTPLPRCTGNTGTLRCTLFLRGRGSCFPSALPLVQERCCRPADGAPQCRLPPTALLACCQDTPPLYTAQELRKVAGGLFVQVWRSLTCSKFPQGTKRRADTGGRGASRGEAGEVHTGPRHHGYSEGNKLIYTLQPVV